MIKFGNFEFKFGFRGSKLNFCGEEFMILINHKIEVFFTLILGWGKIDTRCSFYMTTLLLRFTLLWVEKPLIENMTHIMN